MNEFKYLSYHTEYSCDGTCNKKMSSEVCFSGIFSKITNESDITYNIRLYPGLDLCVESHNSNACLFTKNELKNHLRQLNDMYPFSYRVVEEVVRDKVCYRVVLHLKDVPATFHKYVLTWLRYTYEYPYNVILRDAYILKKDPIFRFESISNIFNVVSICCPAFVGEGHSISADSINKPLRKKELRDRIKEVNRLNGIYEKLKLKKSKLPDKIRDFDCYDAEYWSEELFEFRKPTYMNMFNKIKGNKD